MMKTMRQAAMVLEAKHGKEYINNLKKVVDYDDPYNNNYVNFYGDGAPIVCADFEEVPKPTAPAIQLDDVLPDYSDKDKTAVDLDAAATSKEYFQRDIQNAANKDNELANVSADSNEELISAIKALNMKLNN